MSVETDVRNAWSAGYDKGYLDGCGDLAEIMAPVMEWLDRGTINGVPRDKYELMREIEDYANAENAA